MKNVQCFMRALGCDRATLCARRGFSRTYCGMKHWIDVSIRKFDWSV